MGALFPQKNVVDELASIFRNVDNPVAQAVDWAQNTLQRAGVDATKNPISATKTLRDDEPALSLNAAVYIIKKLATVR